MKTKHLILPLAVIVVLCGTLACDDGTEPIIQKGSFKFNDETLRQIVDLKDRRESDSLLPYLQSDNPVYRREAAFAFGSVQDTSAARPLILLLQDDEPEIRKAAAFALGQTGQSQYYPPLLSRATQEQESAIINALLQAAGKCADSSFLPALLHSDWPVAAESGQAWALYRAGLKGVHSANGTTTAISLLHSKDPQARLGAAHYLYRTRGIDINDAFDSLRHHVSISTDTYVKIALVRAFAKIDHENKTSWLKNILNNSNDYRIKIAALRARPDATDGAFRNTVISLLGTQNPNLSQQVAGYIASQAKYFSDEELSKASRLATTPAVEAIIFQAALSRQSLRAEMNATAVEKYMNAESAYEKGAWVKALARNPANFNQVVEAITTADETVVRTAAMEGLLAMRQLPDFPDHLHRGFANNIKEAILTKDIALVSLASGALQDTSMHLKESYDDLRWLQATLNSLTLPKDIEAAIFLQQAINTLTGTQEPIPTVGYNHPPNWKEIANIPSTQHAIIHTDKGTIVVTLYVEEAPTSVANFIALAEEGFYDDKYFHRVVPDFVIQGGCPRGDGYGSKDYSIRSEFSPGTYGEGALGMASAGKDTEGVQWFITHSPTPHLDGRYTLFGKVIQGMDVVHAMEVGDKIHSVAVEHGIEQH